jgi:seryl-tRNA synthetase
VTGLEDTRRALVDAGQLADGGTEGIYHRSFAFERVLRAVERYVSDAGRGEVDRQLFLAPVQSRSTLEAAGYLSSFPNLIGVVSGFLGGTEQVPAILESVDRGGAWTSMLEAMDLSLTSAACHGLYPLLSSEPIPLAGCRVELQGWCFRHEPSPDPARMQTFRQHEFVFVGSPEGAVAHRDLWQARGAGLLQALGLDVELVVANDPFFGRPGRLLAASQRVKELKHELVAPMTSDTPGAIASTNCHEDHFGVAFSLRLTDGSVAHSACIGFGLERITLALLRCHGLDEQAWPADVRELLGLTDRAARAPHP